MNRRERQTSDQNHPQSERFVRVRLQADVEEHEAEGDIPAGRWAMCKMLYGSIEAGVLTWVEYGPEFRVWDPWDEGGYELLEGTDAKAEHVHWGVDRYEFYDAPCA
jgi:hypothetical protein